MRYITRGRNILSGLAAGFALLGVSALSIAGCSHSANAPDRDDTTVSALDGSSMKVQGNTPATASIGDTAATGAPVAASASAVPAPSVPAVTSPTTPALAAVAPLAPTLPPNLAQGNPRVTAVIASTGTPALNVPTTTSAPAVNVASTGPPVLNGLNGNGMQGAAQTLNPAMMRALKEFQVASASFPDFCRDWSRKLSVREHDNLGHIKWQMRDGVETGSYVGYSSIDSCTCKEASNGVAVGILTYKEFDYTLSGKSVEDARHATPHAATVVPTREIFAYEKGKWFW